MSQLEVVPLRRPRETQNDSWESLATELAYLIEQAKKLRQRVLMLARGGSDAA